MPREARTMRCKVCDADLTAKKVPVPSAIRPGTVTHALRAPERVEVIFDFSGYTPSRKQVRFALCPSCAARTAWTAQGVPFTIPGEDA